MDEFTRQLVMLVNNSSPGNLTLDDVKTLVEEIKLLIREPQNYEVRPRNGAAKRRPRN